MAVFLVERSIPGMSLPDLLVAGRALEESCRRLAPGGVRHLRTLQILGGSRCLSLFEAESKELVAQANSAAQFPFSSVEEVTEVVSRYDGPNYRVTDASRTRGTRRKREDTRGHEGSRN